MMPARLKKDTTMRILIMIMFFAINSLTTFGQNGLKQGDYFLLLSGKKSISLNTFKNNNLNEIKTFDITEKSIYTTDQKSRVAILDTSKNNVLIYDFQSSTEIKLSVPFDLKAKAILLNDNNLFVGGEMGREMLVQYHFQSNEWFNLEIPAQIIFPGKAIDDLVVNDSLLLAIDNLIMPKYILYYHLNETGRLSLSHINDLKSNGTYESIHQGRITSKYFGLISSTYSGYTGASEHITIYKGIDLKKSFAISTGQQDKDFHSFNDFIIIEDKVFIASKEKGLGIFEIKDSYFKTSKDKFDIFNAKVNLSKINYKQHDSGEILKLTIVPNNSKFIMTIRSNIGRISHEIFDL